MTTTKRTDGIGKEFVVDRGSPVTTIPPDKEKIKYKKILPVARNYQEVNKNEVKFRERITVEAKSKEIIKNLSKLNTEREHIKPSLGMECLREFNSTKRHIEKTTKLTDQTERDKVIAKFETNFKTNRSIDDTQIKIQLKPVHLPLKQKAGPKPYHLQNYVEKEISNLIKSRHLEKIQKLDEDCFVSPVAITLKKD